MRGGGYPHLTPPPFRGRMKYTPMINSLLILDKPE